MATKEEIKAKIINLISTEDGTFNIYEGRRLFGELTLNEVCDLHSEYLILGYPIWAVSDSWGFLCLWCSEYRLPKEERSNDIDLFEYETLEFNVKLKNQFKFCVS